MAHLLNMNLPASLIQNLRDIHANADAWLAELDAAVKHLEKRWQLRVAGLVPDLSYNVVAFAQGLDGAPYVLKLSPPNSEFEQEVAALKLYDGDGICRLIQSDVSIGAMLLERVRPGVSLWRTDIGSARDDDLATRTAATLMQQLWRPVSDPQPFRTLRSWTRSLPRYLKTYPNGDGPLPHVFLNQAHDLLTDLLMDSNENTLLHADLHHGNIVTAIRQPHLAIDPKGVVGARHYDLGSFLVNPKPRIKTAAPSDLKEALARRIAIFGEMLDLSREEVAAWGVVHTALEACWTLRDHGVGWEGAVKVAGELEAFL